jgi:alpha-L-arabinofuranosidase
MRYHFEQAIGPLAGRTPQCDPFTGETDPTGYGVDEFMTVAASLGASVTLVTPWVDGSPQEAAAFVAYVNASASSTFAIGVDASGTNWQTAGYWAQQRATNGHAAPYGVKFVEIGNEPYSSLPAGPPTSCGRPSQFVQDQRWVNGVAIPTTAQDYATQLALTGTLIRGVDPTILIGAPVPATFDGVSDAAQSICDGRARSPARAQRRGDRDAGALSFSVAEAAQKKLAG